MASTDRSDWFIPACLIALSIVPMAGGAFRLAQLGGDAAITPDNARFYIDPLPVVLHIGGSALYSIIGALQFAPAFRRRHPGWHRVAGRVLVLCGMVSAATGLWMTLVHPPATFTGTLPASYDGPIVYVMRLLAGTAMALSLVLGVTTVLRRDFPGHEAWMIRAYAIGLGAGTQAITHLPWFLFPDIQGEPARAWFMGAGWVINIAAAEWIISRERRGKRLNRSIPWTMPQGNPTAG